MPTSVELRQERARIVEQMRAITETAEAENRNLDATERESYDRGEAEFRELTERIDRAEALEQREAEQARPLHGDRAAPRPDDGQGDQSQQRRAAFLQFVRRGRGEMAPEQRALVENAAGEILVPEDLETEIYRSLPELTVMRGLASTRPTTSNRVRRRSLDEVAVGWGSLETGEQTLTDSMPSTPREEWTYIEDLYGLAKIGEDELDDTDVNLEAFVRDSFSRAIAEAEDTGFAVGAGHASNQPVGLFSSGGEVPTITGTGSTYNGTDANAPGALLDDLRRLIYAVPAQARRNGAFLMASATELAISQVKDGNGQYLWQPSVIAGRPNTFLGYAVHNQDDIAAIAAGASIAAFGDYASAYRIYDRQGMTLKRLEELYAEDGMIGFKVRFRVGGDVVRPDRVRILKTAAAGGA
ncbi:phage major capsid protein, HK97 family [Saccharopolyspora kobensis]|uniref:Phage major capsid protein, HK97 family n=1 Tax=Saccharopolyspora kobensis TaxID=146035 RepID=A0A1H6DZK7_9PSEU|nr:phage major capsid protein [Saccharopolyspora kobensis]SEG90778.1 phage major capsid protein, HK97 family [Saccharopolyspora kobensis]SFD93790.1 phage major capsid protein, HK97 family [Saccharopolyspora kobensis]